MDTVVVGEDGGLGVNFPERFKQEEGWRMVANGVYCNNTLREVDG